MTLDIEPHSPLTETADRVLQIVHARRSVGRVKPEMPPRAWIEKMIEAATWAPCHHGTEPWTFTVITGDARGRLGDVMAQSKIDRMVRQGKEIDGEFERARAKALRAPVIIAVAVTPSTGPKIVEIEEIEAGAAAVQNMLLTAQALGLATIWRTGDPAYDPNVKAFLGLQPSAHIIGFVYVGYPDATPARVPLRTAESVTTWLEQ